MNNEKEQSPCGCEIVRGAKMLKSDGTWIDVTIMYYPVELSLNLKEDNEDNRT